MRSVVYTIYVETRDGYSAATITGDDKATDAILAMLQTSGATFDKSRECWVLK